MVQHTDAALMSMAYTGSSDAYEVLHLRWNARLRVFLIRKTGDPQAAEDALQETWLRIYRFRDNDGEGCPFRPWAMTIAVNTSRTMWARSCPPAARRWFCGTTCSVRSTPCLPRNVR